MASGNGEDSDPHGGARNLLVNCAGVKAGEQVLIVREDPALGYYDAAAPACVAKEAEALGCRTTEYVNANLLDGPEDLPESLAAAMTGADHTLFFDRMGDQLRFLDVPGGGTKTMCFW